MKYFVQTFGCQMNVHDSRRMEEVLRASGYEAADEPSLADLIVFNTCSVREKAEHKLMSALGVLRPLKEGRRDLVLAVAGCVAQQEGDRLLKKAPYLDVVLGPDNIPELPGLVAHVRNGGPPITRTVFDVDDPRFLDMTVQPNRPEVTAFVTVMKGCDERCTYCIVPTTRGPERYRHADDIVREIRGLVDGGVREVTLLGQTVNSWYEPGGEASRTRTSEFAKLLRRIADEVPGLERLRYTSPHPRHLTDELIEAHRDLEVLPAHVHLPVQSGSNRMLKRMLRRTTREHYLARIAKLKAARPGLTMSTDLIVGFPGETPDDFEDTLSLVREAGFVAAFAFKYSPRPFTPSLKLGDTVTAADKDERLQRLLAQIGEQQKAHLESLVGSRTRVLIEGPSRTGGRFSGRSDRHEIVHVAGPEGEDLTGQLVEVEIESANLHSLLGRIDGVVPRPVPTPAVARRKLPVLAGAEH